MCIICWPYQSHFQPRQFSLGITSATPLVTLTILSKVTFLRGYHWLKIALKVGLQCHHCMSHTHTHTHMHTAKTQLGVWLIEDLHGVSFKVSQLTHSALLYLSVYPLIDAVVSEALIVY